eukprot:767418-Hanusia_phi.AAC.4
MTPLATALTTSTSEMDTFFSRVATSPATGRVCAGKGIAGWVGWWVCCNGWVGGRLPVVLKCNRWVVVRGEIDNVSND